MKRALIALGLLATFGCNQGADAPGKMAQDSERPAADNTAVNARDRSGTAQTPGDQGESPADRSITQRIRQDVVGSDALSMGGKNVKIITTEGVVTLRGPVATAQEKAEIAQIVHKVDGVKRIDNQLEIAAK